MSASCYQAKEGYFFFHLVKTAKDCIALAKVLDITLEIN